MAETDFEKLVFPDEDENPFYDRFQQLMAQLDNRLRQMRIQKDLIIKGGGTIGWNGNQMTWTEDFEIFVPLLQFKIIVKYGPDEATRVANLGNGSFLSVDIPPAMSGNVETVFDVRTSINPEDLAGFVVGYNLDSRLTLRTSVTY